MRIRCHSGSLALAGQPLSWLIPRWEMSDEVMKRGARLHEERKFAAPENIDVCAVRAGPGEDEGSGGRRTKTSERMYVCVYACMQRQE